MPIFGRSRPLLLASQCVAVFCLASCEIGPRGPAVVVRDSLGIQIVESDPEQPAWGGAEWQVAETPLLQLGNIPGDADHLLYRVGHSIRLASGAIAVANTGFGDVRIFDEGGILLRTLQMPITVEGTVNPLRLRELPGDTLLVFLADRTLSVFDAEGSLVRRSAPIATDVMSDPPPELAGILEDGTMIIRSHPPESPTGPGVAWTHLELLRYSSGGAPLGSLGLFEDVAIIPGDEELMFGPRGLQAVGDSTIWHGTSESFEIRETSPEPSLRRIVRLNSPVVEVVQVDTATVGQAAFRQLSNNMEDSIAQRIVESYRYAETFPAYSDMIVDRLGNVWMRAYQWFNFGAPMRWSVFDPAGRFLGDVELPSQLEVHEIGDDYVLGRIANDRGVEAVYLYTITKPAPPPPEGATP